MAKPAESKRGRIGLLVCFFVAMVALLAFSVLRPLRSDRQEVVVYTALDEDFSQPIFDAFTHQTGIVVRAKFDTESTKSVGLTQAILAERDRPRCDLFWNNEIVNTLRLDQAGLLASYPSQQSKAFPKQYRSANDRWFGFAARARVLLVNTELVPEDERPGSILDMTDPHWQGRVGIAKPLAGTTASHAACLFAVWGEQRAKEFFGAVKTNARTMGGNKQVARAVATGELAWGLTDTDDAIIELEKGWPVVIVYPDQAEGEIGTLLIPNTVALVRGAEHSAAAKRLIEFLLSPEVERKLAEGPSAQIPLNPTVDIPLRVESSQTIRTMEVDFQAAANAWPSAASFLKQAFATAD